MFFEVRTIKEDVESLEEIVADIPSDFSAKEKARMVYIELGKNSFFNTKYKTNNPITMSIVSFSI